MLTEAEVRRRTGWTPKQLKTLSQYPLIGRHPVPDRSKSGGSYTLYDDDTIDRSVVINYVWSKVHQLPKGSRNQIAAFELYLQSYKLAPKTVDECLDYYIDLKLNSSALKPRRRTAVATPTTKGQISRRIRERVYATGAASLAANRMLDAMRISAYGAQGILPGKMPLQQYLPGPSPMVEYNTFYANHSRLWDLRHLRELKNRTPDSILMEATALAKELLAQDAKQVVAQAQLQGISEDNFIRAQLPGYPLHVKHTAAQVMLPFRVLFLIASYQEPEVYSGSAVHEANELFLTTLAPAMADVARHFYNQAPY